MRFQLDVVLLKTVLQVHDEAFSREQTLSRDHAAMAEIYLRKELMQDRQLKQAKVLAFIITLRTLVHMICFDECKYRHCFSS